MLELQPGARAYLMEIRALSEDGDGNEVFVGMTLKESVWYQRYLEEAFNADANRCDASQEKYLALHDSHEEARQTAIVGASRS